MPPFGRRVFNAITSLSSPLGPEAFRFVTLNRPLHEQNLELGFVDAIPISVFVSAGKAPTEAPGSLVFIPPETTNMGPGLNRGSGAATRGVTSKNG